MATLAPQIKISQLQEATQSTLPGDPKNTWFVVVNAQTMSTKRVSLNSLLGYFAEFYADPNHQAFFTINTSGGITIDNISGKTIYSGNTITISDNTTISIARSGYNQANLAHARANLAYTQAAIANDRANNTYTLTGANSTFVKLSGGSMSGPLSAPALLYGSNTVLHAQNYNSYAPTKTGTGASGTWGINITGSAASAAALTGPLTSSQITTGLGYTPVKADGTNVVPKSTWDINITGASSSTGEANVSRAQIISLLGFEPPTPTGTGASGVWSISVTGSAASAAKLTGTLTFSQVADGLGYTPARADGTNTTGGVWPISVTGSAASAAKLTGTLTSAQILAGLGYVPAKIDGSNATGVWSININGSAASITGNYTGPLIKPQITTGLGYTPPTPTGTGASGVWPISITGSAASATTLTGPLTSSQITTGLGYTPAKTDGSNATGVWGINISGTAASITGNYTGPITSSQITTGLGYTPPTPTGSGASGVWNINITGTSNRSTYADTSTSGSFFTQATNSEGSIGASRAGQNPAYIFNDAWAWGLYSASGGLLAHHVRSTGLNYFDGKSFQWYDPGGFPTHLWGGSNPNSTNMYVYDLNRLIGGSGSSNYIDLRGGFRMSWGSFRWYDAAGGTQFIQTLVNLAVAMPNALVNVSVTQAGSTGATLENQQVTIIDRTKFRINAYKANLDSDAYFYYIAIGN